MIWKLSFSILQIIAVFEHDAPIICLILHYLFWCISFKDINVVKVRTQSKPNFSHIPYMVFLIHCSYNI